MIITNVFWLYNVIDNALAHDDYKTQCEFYHKDAIEFEKVLSKLEKQEEMMRFLDKNEIDYDSLQKGNESIILLNSFEFTFDKNGILIAE